MSSDLVMGAPPASAGSPWRSTAFQSPMASPLNSLPPVFTTMFISTPPVSDSAVCCEVWKLNSSYMEKP